MVRSMIAAVAGLRTHQSKMDVIGNNIANVNTWGFKSSSFNFTDSMYSTTLSSTGGSTTAGAAGGRNPSQVGYGVTTGSISSSFTTGAPSPSSDPLDCMIDGTGFFLVGGMINGSFTDIESSGLYLSRVGIFRPDDNGYLVDDNRNYVYGYAVIEGTGIPEVPAQAGKYSVEGAEVEYGIEQNDAGYYEITIAGITIQTLSSEYEQQITDWLSAVSGQETVTDADGTVIYPTEDGEENPFAEYNISYTNYQEPATEDGEPVDAYGTVNVTITRQTTGPDSNAAAIMALFNGTDQEVLVEGQDRVAAVDAKYSDSLSTIQIPYDPDTGQQYNILSYTINEDGTIVGVDDQNRVIAIGQIALVTVENPSGLEKTEGYYYTIGDNCGEVGHQAADGGAVGSILGGYLEMANVDLANEFSSMITTQRGFQANSKMITVTDEMLEELVNMKR